MGQLKSLGIWLGKNRGVAGSLAFVTAGVAWAFACVGRLLDDGASPRSVIEIWRQEHRTKLVISAGAHVVFLVLMALSAIGSMGATGFLFAVYLVIQAAAAAEMFACFRSGQDPFAWLAREAFWAPASPGGWLTPSLAVERNPGRRGRGWSWLYCGHGAWVV